jgi:hypothetical protein
MSCGVDRIARTGCGPRVAGPRANSYDRGRNRAMRIDFRSGDERLAMQGVALDFARESEGRTMPRQHQN